MDFGEDVRVFRWRQREMDSPMMKNHTATWFEDSLYIFGGFDGSSNSNVVRRLEGYGKEEWHVVERNANALPPQGRNGHSATLVSKNRILYIGGWLGVGPLGSAEVHVFDLNSHSWSKLDTAGQSPGPCNMHTANYVGNSIYLFRGGDGQIYLNDLHVLDLDTNRWDFPPTFGEKPPIRANHSSATCGNKLYVFGGWNGVDRLNDLFVLDTSTMTWTKVICQGIPPTPRAGSTLNCVFQDQDPTLLLFGGSGAQNACFNDLHAFHLATSTWTKVMDQQQSAQSRETNPNLSSMEDFGLPRTRFIQQGDPPERRAGHTTSLVCLGRKLLVVGGSFGSEYRKTVYELDLDPVPEFPPPRLTPARQLGLAQSLAAQFNQPEFSDVCFVLDGGRIYAHRVVLCSSNNEYFKVLFSSGFREAKQAEIEINDVKYEPFCELVRYLYTCELNLAECAFVQDLFVVADQFMCRPLTLECERELSRQVRAETLDQIYDFASRYEATTLCEYCLHFERWGR
ncbi:hypothetical protein BASA81_002339 [Batrachochytrium salamandrivorans]|nr:hypothetical protein BASA81_002339 [Batrachochytrium salamandrivorans]